MATRLPTRSPVSAVLLRADNDRNGTPRRVFAVLYSRGILEVLEEGYNGDALLTARYPWFSHRACTALGLEPAYHASVDTSPAEVRRLERWTRPAPGDVPAADRLLRMADANARRSAVREVLEEVRRRDVHVHAHDPHRSAKLRALRRLEEVREARYPHVSTFHLPAWRR